MKFMVALQYTDGGQYMYMEPFKLKVQREGYGFSGLRYTLVALQGTT